MPLGMVQITKQGVHLPDHDLPQYYRGIRRDYINLQTPTFTPFVHPGYSAIVLYICLYEHLKISNYSPFEGNEAFNHAGKSR